MLEVVPGAETWAEHVSRNPSSLEELCLVNELNHSETVAKASAQLLLCLVAQMILQLQDEKGLLLFSCLVFPWAEDNRREDAGLGFLSLTLGRKSNETQINNY